MEDKKKLDLKSLRESVSDKARVGFAKAKDSAGKIKDSVIQSIDQTGDGKFGKEDIAEIKRQLQEKQRQAKLRRDLDALNPVFPSDLLGTDFFLPKMVQVAEMDKKHAASSVCVGSIGHETLVKELRVVTVYPDRVDEWGDLKFYPNKDQEYYYMSPVDSHQFIAVSLFFDYLRQARVSELEKIAQDLGATYFKVSIGERAEQQKKNQMTHKSSQTANIPIKGIGAHEKTNVEHSVVSVDISSVKIDSESSFKGHDPVTPQLVYYRNEPQIQGLVNSRLDNSNRITKKRFTLEASQTCGITQKDIANIDTALSIKKIGGNSALVSTFAHEAHQEVRRVFQYDIEF